MRTGELTSRAASLVIDRQLVSPAQVHRYGLRVRDVSQSNGVALVESGDGRGFAVKDMRKLREGGQGSPEREVALYRAASRRDELRRFIAGFVHHDPEEEVLVVEALLTSRRLDAGGGGRHVFDPEVAGWFGAALGSWHREAVVIDGLGETDPWMLHIDDPDRRLPVLDTDARLAEVAGRILDDPTSREILELTRGAWRRETVIHGDVRFANVMVCKSPPAIRFIDWETSGWGDPAWDLGAAAQEYLSACIGLGESDPVAEALPMLEALLASYAHASGREIGWPQLAPFVACRLLMRAMQLANWDGDAAEGVDRHLALAPRVARCEDGGDLLPRKAR